MKGYKKDGQFHPIRNKRSPSKNRKKKFENAKIQSLIFPKKGSNKFTNTTALAWASSHGFKAVKVEPTKNTLRIRQFSPNKIKRGTECKTIQFGGSGVQGVLCDTPEKFKHDEGDRFGNPIGTKYNIVRFFNSGGSKIIHRNVSDVVAQLHTNDPRTRKAGVYFDGFRKVT